MLYYKIFRDKDFTNYLPIDETELEKALVAFRLGKSAIFKSGALEKLGDIVPDYHRTMGWNPTHRLDDDDWADMRSKGVDKKLTFLVEAVKNKIDYLIETKQEHLLGKDVPVVIPEKTKELSSATALLASKFKIGS